MEELGYSIKHEGEGKDGGKDVSFELHVLARAYRDACLALTQRPPVGQLRLEDLKVTIEFEKPGGG